VLESRKKFIQHGEFICFEGTTTCYSIPFVDSTFPASRSSSIVA
jgi:hypothetical protein